MYIQPTRKYVDQDDPWMGILADAAFSVRSTIHTFKGYTLWLLVFGRDMILPIKNLADWKLMLQWKQAQIN